MQQHWDAQRNLRAEASIFAQISTQLNAEFRMLEYDTSFEKDELNWIPMQEFAIQAEETVDAQRQLYIQEAGEEISTNEDASVPWSITSRAVQRIKVWSLQPKLPSSRRSNLKGIDCKVENRFCRMKHGDESIGNNRM